MTKLRVLEETTPQQDLLANLVVDLSFSFCFTFKIFLFSIKQTQQSLFDQD